MLGSLILYLKGMRIMMFQLSDYYYSIPYPKTLSLFWSPLDCVRSVPRAKKLVQLR